MSDRREQIIRAATELLQESGYEGMTVRKVAARAGIGASTLRHYFRTQRDLARAVGERHMAEQLRDLRIADDGVPPAERLVECLLQFLPGSDQEREALRDVAGLIGTALGPGSTSAQHDAYREAVRIGDGAVTGWLRILAGQGHVAGVSGPGGAGEADQLEDSDDATLARHARLLLAVTDGLAIRTIAEDGPVTLEDVRAHLHDVVTRVVLT